MPARLPRAPFSHSIPSRAAQHGGVVEGRGMSPEHHLLLDDCLCGRHGSGRKTNMHLGGGRKQAADAGRRDIVSGGGQGELAGGWAGGWPPGCPVAPGQGRAPRLFRLGLAGNLSRESVSGGMPPPRGPRALTASTPCHLGSDSTSGWVAQPRTPGLSCPPPIHSCPQPLPVVMPSAILPQHSSFIHPTSHSD